MKFKIQCYKISHNSINSPPLCMGFWHYIHKGIILSPYRCTLAFLVTFLVFMVIVWCIRFFHGPPWNQVIRLYTVMKLEFLPYRHCLAQKRLTLVQIMFISPE
jgi:hypothetical protein